MLYLRPYAGLRQFFLASSFDRILNRASYNDDGSLSPLADNAAAIGVE